MASRLSEAYKKEIRPRLMERFGYKNPLEAPRLVKVVVNMGIGEAAGDQKLVEGPAKQLAMITGQKPAYRRARKSISNFKLRKGQVIGLTCTLRGERMYEFLDRLMNVALPRIRDFRGVPNKGFDGRGNYTLGLREQLIFPEVDYDLVDRTVGMNVSIVTTARTDEEAKELLTLLGMPFARR